MNAVSNRSAPWGSSGVTLASGAGTTLRGGTALGGGTGSTGSGAGTAVRSIATGFNFTCVLTTAGGIRCWGSNGAGQLDDGKTTERFSVPPTDGLTDVKAIAAGLYQTCALTTSGGAVAGEATTTDRSAAAPIFHPPRCRECARNPLPKINQPPCPRSRTSLGIGPFPRIPSRPACRPA
jgi:hypothetical protein